MHRECNPHTNRMGLVLGALRPPCQFQIVPKQVSLRLPTDLWNRAQRELGAVKGRPEYEGIQLSTSRVLIMAIARGLPLIADGTKQPPTKVR